MSAGCEKNKKLRSIAIYVSRLSNNLPASAQYDRFQSGFEHLLTTFK